MYSHRCSRSQRILQNFVLSLSRCSSNASDNITIHASMIVRFPLVFSSLLAQLCKPSLSAALLLPSLDNSQLPHSVLRCSLSAFAISARICASTFWLAWLIAYKKGFRPSLKGRKPELLNLRVTTFIHDRLASATSLSPPAWTYAL